MQDRYQTSQNSVEESKEREHQLKARIAQLESDLGESDSMRVDLEAKNRQTTSHLNDLETAHKELAQKLLTVQR